MTAALDEATLRHRYVDYRVTTSGCNLDDIDGDASVNERRVGSPAAVPALVELDDRQNVDAHDDVSDDASLQQLSERLG